MNISTHRLSLDVAAAASHSAVTLRRGENAHRLEISFTDNGLPYRISGECYAVFTAKKSDGTQLFNNCTIVNDSILYDLTAQTTAAPGRLACEVRLYGADSKLIIAPKFSMFVEDSAIDEDAVESSDEFSALNELVSQAATVTVFKLKSYFDTADELLSISSPAVGDAYGIGTQAPYEIYVWDAVNSEWINHGTLCGEEGAPGPQGEPGATGAKGEPGVSGVYVGGGEAPDSYSVQIDPEGSADELVTEAPNDGQQYARKNKTWAAVTGGGEMKFKLMGTAQTPDADGYVNIPSASTDGVGVVRVSNTYGTTVNPSNGYLSAQSRTLAQYNSGNNYMFIGKATLENIKTDVVKRALAGLDAAGQAEVIASIGITVDSNGICHFGS